MVYLNLFYIEINKFCTVKEDLSLQLNIQGEFFILRDRNI